MGLLCATVLSHEVHVAIDIADAAETERVLVVLEILGRPGRVDRSLGTLLQRAAHQNWLPVFEELEHLNLSFVSVI